MHSSNNEPKLTGSIVAIFFLIIMLFSGVVLHGASLAENDHFGYIIELYYGSEAWVDELQNEIKLFRAQYPSSEYNLWIDLLDANLTLQAGEVNLALQMYDKLASTSLPLEMMNEYLLNYSIARYYAEDYLGSIELLDRLLFSTDEPYYRYQTLLWSGRSHAMLGFYLTAENNYRQALQIDPQEALLEYFKVVLELGHDDLAWDILASLDSSVQDTGSFTHSWLSYLLASGQFDEFDDYLAGLPYEMLENDSAISLLRVRRYLETGDYDAASGLLSVFNTELDLQLYYTAVVLANTSREAEADLILKQLLSSPEKDIPELSYLSRLDILHKRDPEAAIEQLERYLSRGGAGSSQSWMTLASYQIQSGRHLTAVKSVINAQERPLSRIEAERADNLLAQAYYLLGDYELCADRSNLYLNQYPFGKHRDAVLLYQGLAYLALRDTSLARLSFEKLAQDHPNSFFASVARQNLAELLFQQGSYQAAADTFETVNLNDENRQWINLRLAQSYFYLDNLGRAREYLTASTAIATGYEQALLLGAIQFNERQLESALETFTNAELMADTPIRESELKAYRAYTLFNLKRYSEAEQLYFDLSRDSLNGDIYLYQAAKASAQSGNLQRALTLYDQFIDEFQGSDYLQRVLVETATTLYNLGRYDEALTDWLNILRRYSAHTFLTESELTELADVFTGIELACLKSRSDDCIQQLIEIMDVFRSDYIKFELEFISVKLFANAELWEEVLIQAQELRNSLDLPLSKRSSLESLLAESLIRLNRLEEAENFISDLEAQGSNPEYLLKLAEIAELSGNIAQALDRYLAVYRIVPTSDLWLKTLELSASVDFTEFESLWQEGRSDFQDLTQARLFLAKYRIDQGDWLAAIQIADSILATEPNRPFRAEADLVVGQAQMGLDQHLEAQRTFRKVRTLYPDLPGLPGRATYLQIKALQALGMQQEAILTLKEFEHTLSPPQKEELYQLIQGTW